MRVGLTAALVLLAGCANYRIGGPPPPFRTIEVAPVRNATSLTGVHAALHTRLAEAFAMDPRVRLGPGGARLEAELVSFRRTALSARADDARDFSSHRTTYVVRCTLTTDAGTRTVFKDRDFSGTFVFQPTGDTAAAELSLGPAAYADIAAQVKEAATAAW
ncbi:MAG: hypothetical protein ACO3ND_00410 [Opitutales bacterium]